MVRTVLEAVFTKGWEINALLYGLTFLLAQYAVYNIIFRGLVGDPRAYSFVELQYWMRKANFLGAVVFAPLFEEIMFTYLAYFSFLGYAQPGKEGIVLLFVASFFALLHLPGDLQQSRYYPAGRKIYVLSKSQLQRFFYSLAAFFIFQQTGQLWITITLHYVFNALVSYFNLHQEDHPLALEKLDGLLVLIMAMNGGFAIVACYFFYGQYADLGIYLVPLVGFIILDGIKTCYTRI